jgi:transglutaminase-like putative cysteine protease
MNAAVRLWKRVLMADWQRRLTHLLVGMYILQFVEWIEKEDHVWLPVTVYVVKLTLLVIFAAELIPKIHWSVRSLLQLIGIIAVDYIVLHENGLIPKWELSPSLITEFPEHFIQLTPYLWFTLGAWVVYLAAVWWVEAKWRIFALLVCSVLAISIRDSFSKIYLWPEVAVILLCGLFLLIICHFRQLGRKNPSIHGYLGASPVTFVVPVVLLVSLTVLIGTLMPEIKPILTDPYTAWRNMHGQPANFVTGKGIEVTEPLRDKSSGYSRNDRTLGGGFRFDYTPVMTVETTHRSYWRGETRSFYTGRGWQMSEAEKHQAVTGVRADQPLPQDAAYDDSQVKTIEVRQTFSFLTDQAYPVLFGSPFIQKLEETDGSKAMQNRFLWSAKNGELRVNEKVKQPYPKSYTVISRMPVIDENGLRQAPLELPNPGAFADYLQLPDRLPARVRQLAADLTKDASNPYDKAKKIEEYLSTTFPYTSNPDTGKSRSRDFVDSFLFEIKEGYCDYYSTAMAVMLRSIGIPTRWVKGYASGVLENNENPLYGLILGDSDSGGVYTVRNADAHSWVEVYFSGWGWIPFEPTSGFSLPQAVLEPESSPELPADVPDIGETSPVNTQESAARHVVPYSIPVVILAAIAYLIWKFEWIGLIRERLNQRRAYQFKQKVIVECEKLFRIFRRKGYVRFEHETLREAVRRWSEQSGWMKEELDVILAVFEKAKYSKAEVTEQDWLASVQSVQKLRSKL